MDLPSTTTTTTTTTTGTMTTAAITTSTAGEGVGEKSPRTLLRRRHALRRSHNTWMAKKVSLSVCRFTCLCSTVILSLSSSQSVPSAVRLTVTPTSYLPTWVVVPGQESAFFTVNSRNSDQVREALSLSILVVLSQGRYC